jgi:hypothetical protein
MRYRLNGREVTKEEWGAHRPNNPCNYAAGEIPTLRMGADWSAENGGKGRRITQIATSERDGDCYCKTPAEALEKATRRGLVASKSS